LAIAKEILVDEVDMVIALGILAKEAVLLVVEDILVEEADLMAEGGDFGREANGEVENWQQDMRTVQLRGDWIYEKQVP